MRIAILTDIHANREALTAVLDDARARAVTMHAILGDIVGYGPDPVWCLERIAEMATTGTPCVLGNHDSAILRDEQMNPVARAAIDWTRTRLDAAARAFLRDMPLTMILPDPGGDILLTHASANVPQDWIYVTGAATAMPSFRVSTARIILCGHTHRPAIYSCDHAGRVQGYPVAFATPQPLLASRRWLAVVGSVGQPRDGVPQAGYAILDTDHGEITFRRVPYDTETTAAKIRAAGLPEALAIRLLEGK